MTRVASQLTFCSPKQILHRMVVEQDEQNFVTRLFCLDDNPVESSNTLFFDGIISAEIVSIKEKISPAEIAQLVIDYNYVEVSDNPKTDAIIYNNKPLLLDFGITSPNEINRKLTHIASTLSSFSIFEIIAGCVYYPTLILNQPASLTENRRTRLMLWEGVDLVNKRITAHTQIREIK